MSRRKTPGNPVNPESTLRIMRGVLLAAMPELCGTHEVTLEIILQAMADSLTGPSLDQRSGEAFLASTYFDRLCEMLKLEPEWVQSKWKHAREVYETQAKGERKNEEKHNADGPGYR